MATLRLILGTDPRALLEAAAEGFLTSGGAGAAGGTGSGPAVRPSGDTAGSPELFPSPGYLLSLRQGGLRDDLLALAAERGVPGWFDPPLCLFQQLPEWLGSTHRVPCGDYERVVLLSRLLRESAPGVFGRLRRPDAFVDAVDRLFGELVAEGVRPEAFEAALAARPDRDAFESARDEDLSACYRAYRAALERADRRDGRDRLIDCAEAIVVDPEAFAERMGGRREIRIFGLQDLRGGWPALLRALRESPALDRITLYSVASLEGFAALRLDGVERLDPLRGLAAQLFGTGAPAEPHPVPIRIVSAPDIDRETEDVAQRVRALIDQGADPRGIVVVARSARPYVERAVEALAKYGVPATARRRHAFAEIPVVRALLSLFSVAAEGWTRHGLVELAEQPYFGRHSRGTATVRRLDPVVLNYIGYHRRVMGLDAWIAAHEELYGRAKALEARIESGEDERAGRDAPPSSVRVGEAKVFFARFASDVRVLERPRPLREWVDWLHDFLEADPWKIEAHVFHLPEDRYHVARLDAAGIRGVRQILAQWHDALDTWGGGDEVLDVSAFESQLREMLSGDAALWTVTRRAVPVSEGLAVAQRAFEHVFVVGLAGAAFPRRSPRSPILDDRDRAALVEAGLPIGVADDWERRERELFRVLVAGAARSLTLSAPRTDEQGRELGPSAFLEEAAIVALGESRWDEVLEEVKEGALHVEAAPHLTVEFLPGSEVVAPSLALVPDADARGFAAHAARIERERRTGRLSPWNGRIETPELRAWVAERLGEEYVWSPTQLESYAKCAWSWFSQRLLRLEHLSDPDIDIDPITRGNVLHDAMRRFYELAFVTKGGPVLLRDEDREWAANTLEQLLDESIRDTDAIAWLGVPALHRTKRDELLRMLRRFVAWEIEHNEEMFDSKKKKAPRILRTGVTDHELTFGTGEAPEHDAVQLERAGIRFRLRGSVDRVERGVDERLDPGERDRYIAAVDYKTSLYATPGAGKSEAWADGVVLQVPLYAHVLQRLQPGSRVSRVEYRAFKQTGVQHSLQLYQIDKSDELVVEPEAAARMETALDDAGRHVARARCAEFPAHPAPSCACPPFCHALDICRVAIGPRSGREADAEWKRQAARIRTGEVDESPGPEAAPPEAVNTSDEGGA